MELRKFGFLNLMQGSHMKELASLKWIRVL